MGAGHLEAGAVGVKQRPALGIRGLALEELLGIPKMHACHICLAILHVRKSCASELIHTGEIRTPTHQLLKHASYTILIWLHSVAALCMLPPSAPLTAGVLLI